MRRRTAGTVLMSLGLLLLGAVFAAGASAGGGCHGANRAAATDEASSVVRIDLCSFTPTVTRVAAGTAVTFVNVEQVPHNVTGVANAWASPSELELGMSFVHRFATAGIYPYACTLHPGMNGAVVVGEGSVALSSSPTPGTGPTASADTGAPVSPDTGAPVSVALAGASGLALGAMGAGLLLHRREPATTGK